MRLLRPAGRCPLPGEVLSLSDKESTQRKLPAFRSVEVEVRRRSGQNKTQSIHYFLSEKYFRVSTGIVLLFLHSRRTSVTGIPRQTYGGIAIHRLPPRKSIKRKTAPSRSAGAAS